MTKRICILGPAYPYRGGIAATNERLAQEYSQQGNTVEIITFTLQYPSILFPGKSQLDLNKKPPNLNIQRKLNSINPINWWSTGRYIRNQNYDLVIVRYWLPFLGPSLGTVLRQVKKNRQTKIVCILDNLIPHESRPGDKLFTRYFVKPIDGFVAMSKSVQAELGQFDSSKKCLYTPHPLFDHFGEKMDKASAIENLNLPKGKHFLLFFGFIRAYKGLDLLLEALSKVKNENIHLIIAGEYYEEEEKYIDLIHQLQLQDRVHNFNEFIADDRINQFFGAADLVAQPYRTATQSGVAQIAFHFEKPILVTDVGGLPEIVSHKNSGYITKVDPSDIAQKINDFYEENRSEHFESFIQKEKDRFSWKKMTETIDTFVQ